MKNKLFLLLILFILTLSSTIYFYFSKNSISLSYTDQTLYIELTQNNTKEIIYPFYDKTEDCHIFFLPSYSTNASISLDSNISGKICANNTPISSSRFNCSEELVYVFTPQEEPSQKYNIKFLYSENIPSLFLSVINEDLAYIYADKNNYASASMTFLNSTGTVEYQGAFESLSGRGNSTWGYEKKPFSLKFNKPVSFCGLASSSKWVLLANWRDASKIQNKLTYDIANIFNIAYTPRSTWVDLYINGEYRGNYLLSSPVSVDENNLKIQNLEKQNLALNPNIENASTFQTDNLKGYQIDSPINITGGYLIEKDLREYNKSELNGFITDEGFTFTIKHPQHASYEQVNYIYNYIQNIENLILSNAENISEYLDLDSYSKAFLINEITMNYDTGITSMYFYKDANNDVLYSGPIWDYDYAYGIPAFPKWSNYTTSLLDCELIWNKHLYNNPTFYDLMKKNFEIALPMLEELIFTKIDDYAQTISKSASMDRICWQKYNKFPESYYYGHYYSYTSDIEYLKYFLINRINFLITLWDIDYPLLNFNSEEKIHTVSFVIGDDVISQQKIQHGDYITTLPTLPSENYSSWYLLPRKEPYTKYLPILEDAILVAE